MRAITKLVSISWIVNFAIYVAMATMLGGDALNGHAEAGRYFLAWHGHATEVSRATFEYSQWHTYVLVVHFAVAFVLGLFVRHDATRPGRAA
jgi:hypothetical protein